MLFTVNAGECVMNFEELWAALDLIALAEVHLQKHRIFDERLMTAHSALRLARDSILAATHSKAITLLPQRSPVAQRKRNR
jgi:hypothetical protein